MVRGPRTVIQHRKRLLQALLFVLLVQVVLISMHRLLMLPQVVQPTEILGTIRTGKRSFSSVLSLVPGKVLRPSKRHTTAREACALEDPALALLLVLSSQVSGA